MKILSEIRKKLTSFYNRVSGQFKKTQVDSSSINEKNINLTFYFNYMKDTVGTSQEQWIKIKESVTKPIVLITLILGIGTIFPAIYCDNVVFKMLFTALSTIGLSTGVNYFSFFLKEKNEFNLLKNKGELIVKTLNNKIEKLIMKDKLSNEDKNDITDFLSLIDCLKKYVEFADTSKISYHKRLESEIKLETNEKRKVLLISRKESLERNWADSGVGSFITISGSVIYDYNKPEETKYIIPSKQTNRMGDFKEPRNRRN